MVDIILPMAVEAYPDYKIWMDIAMISLRIGCIIAAVCVIKRGQWKIRHIGHNKKLIKDEAWKDIHMTVPRRIVVLTLISMSCYILYQSIYVIISAMMYFGYMHKDQDQDQPCQYTY